MVEETTNIEKAKQHFKKYGSWYLAGAAGITCIIMRRSLSESISGGISVAADRGISVVGKKVAMNNVSYISANRKGSPSWVVRCLDTNDVFTSQRSAAMKMDLPQNELSKHLNGKMDNVRGYSFERLCMAA